MLLHAAHVILHFSVKSPRLQPGSPSESTREGTAHHPRREALDWEQPQTDYSSFQSPHRPPSLDDVDRSRAPSKTRPSSPVLDSLPSRILFPSAESSSSAESHSSAVDPDDSPDDGASTILVQPLGHSFLDDFVPRGISGSDLLAGSTAVIHSTSSALNHTATALNTTAAAVRQMFGSSSDRQAGPKATVGPDDTLVLVLPVGPLLLPPPLPLRPNNSQIYNCVTPPSSAVSMNWHPVLRTGGTGHGRPRLRHWAG